MTPPVPGRAAADNPPNRFETRSLEPLPVEWPDDDAGPQTLRTQAFRDRSRTLLVKNDSPDVPFAWSINPYRGCEHGCIYCYARPSHEYLGFSAGLDFETKLMVKENAPLLLEAELSRAAWRPEVVCLSGNTDPWQPIERTLGLSRRLLEVFLRHRHPVAVITKSALIERDVDILAALAADGLVSATISVTTLDPEIARAMEPRAAVPRRRLEAIATLTAAGVPVSVNVAPIIPGLTDEEMPAIMQAARAAGATRARYIVARLPGAVEGLFVAWLHRSFPLRAERVLARLRDMRAGRLDDPRFGTRMHGEGEYAAIVKRVFDIHRRRLGFASGWPDLRTDRFIRRPGHTEESQGELFASPP